MDTGQAPKTDRTQIRREPERGEYSWDAIGEILRAGYICHLGIAVDGQPFVVPTTYALAGDDLLIHGSSASRTISRAGEGLPVCVTVTHVDGFVMARSVFNHSFNYRSVMVFGRASVVDDPEAKRAVLRDFFEGVLPGRWDEVRPPSEQEWKATSILRLPLTEASAKVRTGPPNDDDADYELDVWAGVVPIEQVFGEPQPDPMLREGIEESAAAHRLRERYG